MRTINRRLLNLEKALGPAIHGETDWDEMARLRDELLSLAEQDGTSPVTELKQELNALGPTGLWLDVARTHLLGRGFEQRASESFAQTMARAICISTDELRDCIEEGRLEALLERFKDHEVDTDNVT